MFEKNVFRATRRRKKKYTLANNNLAVSNELRNCVRAADTRENNDLKKKKKHFLFAFNKETRCFRSCPLEPE